ncbi:unnamed protein product [Cunninghamella blakesleeana]
MKNSRHGNNEEYNHKLPISKNDKPTFKIPLRLPPRHLKNSSSTSSSSTTFIHSIAYTMKQRMKMAVNKMAYKNTVPSHISSSNNNKKPSYYDDLSTSSTTTSSSSFVKPTLKNGTLLKQYLSFVENELNTTIQLDTTLNNDEDPQLPSIVTTFKKKQQQHHHQLNKSGATLIEAIIHQNDYDDIDDDEKLVLDQQEQQQQSTPRKKSKPLHSTTNQQPIHKKPDTNPHKIKKAPQKPITTSTAIIQCICTTPNEEFGAMVQCDDCASWLHLDCLALDEHALEESFRCPSCYMSLGPGQHHLTSSLTWRFAAQLKSKRLALRRKNKSLPSSSSRHHPYKRKSTSHRHQQEDSSSDEDENDLPPQPDWLMKEQVILLKKNQQQNEKMMSTITTTPTTTNNNTNNNTTTTTNNNNNDTNDNNDNKKEEDENMDSDTTETDWEISLKRISTSSSSRTRTPSLPSLSPCQTAIHSGCSSDMDSPSDEVSTPDHEDSFFYHPSSPTTTANNLIHSTATSSTCFMDNESLMWLSRLAYLESLQTSCINRQQQCFTPNASDVFLCDQKNQQQSISSLPLLLLPTLSSSSSSSSSSTTLNNTNRIDLPSNICSQDLSQFSFDEGPFWSPIH